MKEPPVTEPVAHSSPYTHEKVFELLAGEPRGKLLDAPAGEGHASKHLKAMGFEVYAVDLDEGDYKLSDIHLEKADLNARLPFPEAFFDHIVCLEGIEHIENPHHLIREFRRILKVGGTVTISTPNVLCVYSRLRFLLSGYADWIHGRINQPRPVRSTDLLERHINMLDYPEMHFILKENGFEITAVTSNQSCLTYPWGPAWVRPLASLTFFVLTEVIKFYSRVIKKDTPLAEILLSKDMLFGELVIVKAIKRNP